MTRGYGLPATDPTGLDNAVAVGPVRLGSEPSIDQARLGDSLPYPASTFDTAVCALIIHCVVDQPASFSELYRVVLQGGVLIVSTQHPTTDWLRYGGSYSDTVLETDTWRLRDGDQHVRFWREPLSALCAAATDSGWLIERLIEPRPAETMRDHARDVPGGLRPTAS